MHFYRDQKLFIVEIGGYFEVYDMCMCMCVRTCVVCLHGCTVAASVAALNVSIATIHRPSQLMLECHCQQLKSAHHEQVVTCTV